MDLKRSMVKPASPEEDLVSFSLKRGMLRMTNFETLDQSDTFDFQWVGPEEGQKLLDRDTQRKAREDGEARERERRKEDLAQETKKLQAAAEAKQVQREKEEAERKEQEEREKKDAEQREAEKRTQEEARRKEQEEKRREEEKRRAEQRRLEEEFRKEQEEKRREEERRRAEQRRLDEARRKEEEEKRQEQERQRREEEERRKKDEEKKLAEKSTEAEKRTSGSNGGEEALREILVYIDRDLDLTTKLRVGASTTVRALKEQLAEADPSALARPEDFEFADAASGAELSEHDLVDPSWRELEVVMRGER